MQPNIVMCHFRNYILRKNSGSPTIPDIGQQLPPPVLNSLEPGRVGAEGVTRHLGDHSGGSCYELRARVECGQVSGPLREDGSYLCTDHLISGIGTFVTFSDVSL
jgi:hypothetical protein